MNEGNTKLAMPVKKLSRRRTSKTSAHDKRVPSKSSLYDVNLLTQIPSLLSLNEAVKSIHNVGNTTLLGVKLQVKVKASKNLSLSIKAKPFTKSKHKLHACVL